MAKKVVINKGINGRNAPRPIGKLANPTVKNFGDLGISDNEHRRLDEMLDQTIYIVNIEPQESREYGSGFKLYFKDIPNEQATYTASSFSRFNHGQLKALYDATHNGDKLLPNTCIKAVIRAAGNSYRLE